MNTSLKICFGASENFGKDKNIFIKQALNTCYDREII